jgi:hypothetical protein
MLEQRLNIVRQTGGKNGMESIGGIFTPAGRGEYMDIVPVPGKRPSKFKTIE